MSSDSDKELDAWIEQRDADVEDHRQGVITALHGESWDENVPGSFAFHEAWLHLRLLRTNFAELLSHPAIIADKELYRRVFLITDDIDILSDDMGDQGDHLKLVCNHDQKVK